MKKITDIHELRQIQMGILDEVHQYSEAHGLRYFLSSGTLIGAVRHKGYIPWDDDIDVYMPRKDYERFLREFKGNEQYKLLNPAKEPHYYYTFAKVIDLRTRMVEDETEGFEIGVYMDIFPVDYVPDDMKSASMYSNARSCFIKFVVAKYRRTILCIRVWPIGAIGFYPFPLNS